MLQVFFLNMLYSFNIICPSLNLSLAYKCNSFVFNVQSSYTYLFYCDTHPVQGIHYLNHMAALFLWLDQQGYKSNLKYVGLVVVIPLCEHKDTSTSFETNMKQALWNTGQERGHLPGPCLFRTRFAMTRVGCQKTHPNVWSRLHVLAYFCLPQ